jgi:cytochrome c-type biogenesis protein CcmH/NrfG
MTRRERNDPGAWLLAARCLAGTSNAAWAYRCYRRAARLRPDDRALAEEIGSLAAAVGIAGDAVLDEARK